MRHVPSQNSKGSSAKATGMSLASHIDSNFCKKASTPDVGVKNNGICTLIPKRREAEFCRCLVFCLCLPALLYYYHQAAAIAAGSAVAAGGEVASVQQHTPQNPDKKQGTIIFMGPKLGRETRSCFEFHKFVGYRVGFLFRDFPAKFPTGIRLESSNDKLKIHELETSVTCQKIPETSPKIQTVKPQR